MEQNWGKLISRKIKYINKNSHIKSFKKKRKEKKRQEKKRKWNERKKKKWMFLSFIEKNWPQGWRYTGKRFGLGAPRQQGSSLAYRAGERPHQVATPPTYPTPLSPPPPFAPSTCTLLINRSPQPPPVPQIWILLKTKYIELNFFKEKKSPPVFNSKFEILKRGPKKKKKNSKREFTKPELVMWVGEGKVVWRENQLVLGC